MQGLYIFIAIIVLLVAASGIVNSIKNKKYQELEQEVLKELGFKGGMSFRTRMSTLQ